MLLGNHRPTVIDTFCFAVIIMRTAGACICLFVCNRQTRRSLTTHFAFGLKSFRCKRWKYDASMRMPFGFVLYSMEFIQLRRLQRASVARTQSFSIPFANKPFIYLCIRYFFFSPVRAARFCGASMALQPRRSSSSTIFTSGKMKCARYNCWPERQEQQRQTSLTITS